MNKINWKQKLSSRKFWAAVGVFATAIMVALAAYDGTISQVSAVNIAGGVLIANIIGEIVEILVDANQEYSGEGKEDNDGEQGN